MCFGSTWRFVEMLLLEPLTLQTPNLDLYHSMKTGVFVIGFVFLLFGKTCCKESENEGYTHDDVSNLTTDDEDNQGLLANLMRTQHFTAGTLLGLVVAAIVIVIGSYLVLWRVCCDVEVVITREVMEPLTSISHKVDNSPKSSKKSVSTERLLGHECTSSVLQIT